MPSGVRRDLGLGRAKSPEHRISGFADQIVTCAPLGHAAHDLKHNAHDDVGGQLNVPHS